MAKQKKRLPLRDIRWDLMERLFAIEDELRQAKHDRAVQLCALHARTLDRMTRIFEEQRAVLLCLLETQVVR